MCLRGLLYQDPAMGLGSHELLVFVPPRPSCGAEVDCVTLGTGIGGFPKGCNFYVGNCLVAQCNHPQGRREGWRAGYSWGAWAVA